MVQIYTFVFVETESKKSYFTLHFHSALCCVETQSLRDDGNYTLLIVSHLQSTQRKQSVRVGLWICVPLQALRV